MILFIFNQYLLIIYKKLVTIIDLGQAIILKLVRCLLDNKKEDKRNFHQVRDWIYNKINEWQEDFLLWSKERINRYFNKPRRLGFIEVGKFNQYKMNEPLSYTIDYEEFKQCIRSNLTDDSPEKDLMEKYNLSPAIPETSSETTTEIYIQSVYLEKEVKEVKKENKNKDRLTDKQIHNKRKIIKYYGIS